MSRLGKGNSVVVVGVEFDFAPDVLDSILRLGAQISATVLLSQGEWNLAGVAPYQPDDMPADLLTKDFFITRTIPANARRRQRAHGGSASDIL